MKSSTDIATVVHTISLTDREARNVDANTIVDDSGNSFYNVMYDLPHVYSANLDNINTVTFHMSDFTTTEQLEQTIQQVEHAVRCFTRKQ